METMYPLDLMEFLALSEHPFRPAEDFTTLPKLGPDAVRAVEQMRPRGMWVLVQTEQGLRRTLRPHPKDLFRDALRARLPDTPPHECRR